MFYKRKRQSPPQSDYGPAIGLMERFGWSWSEAADFYQNAPVEMYDEMLIRHEKQNLARANGDG